MSKSEILAALPRLSAEDREEILSLLWRLEEDETIRRGASASERALLDRELADYEATRDPGHPWPDVEKRLRRQT